MESTPEKSLPSSPGADGAVCGACASPAPDPYFSSTGITLCRVCYYAEQTRAQNARAVQSLAADTPAGFTSARLRDETRASNIRTGWIALATCVGITMVTAVLLNRIYLWSGILGLFSLRAFARALKLPRLDGRRGNIGVVLGIAATLLVLFAIVAVAILGI